MTENLPVFRRRRHDDVLAWAERAFARGPRTALCTLTPHAAGHYTAVFLLLDLFTLQPGAAAPTRSQWSTLKKRLKRLNPNVLVLRDYGEVPCPEDCGPRCGRISFGFLPPRDALPPQDEA